MIIRSKLPQAEKFESWVFDEVLPSIRKTGGYIPVEKNDDEASIMAKALMIAQNTLNKKNELLKAKDNQIQAISNELESKNKFINQISISENSLLVREVAKIISNENMKIGERELLGKLREWGFISKNTREPRQCGIDRDYFEVSEGAKQVTGKVFTYRKTELLDNYWFGLKMINRSEATYEELKPQFEEIEKELNSLGYYKKLKESG